MGSSDMSGWRYARRRKESMESAPWWTWPFSLLWRRPAEVVQDTEPEPDTITVPVPDHDTTIPMEYKE